jgi:hypothetical protein
MKSSRTYFIAMGLYWIVFGLITIFSPGFMDIFQTEAGINAKSDFSNHVWRHGGFDIVALCIILFALSGETVSRRIVRATAFAALMPSIIIFYSLASSNYWNPLFIVAGLGCFAFVVWGFVLSGKVNKI